MENTCFIHCEDCVGPLTNFTEVSFQRFLECRKQWMRLNGCQRDIALNTTQIISIEEGDRYENFNELAFHRKCYSAFTNKTLLNRAEARHKKAEKRSRLHWHRLTETVITVILFRRKFCGQV